MTSRRASRLPANARKNALVLGALGVLGLVAWSGCGPGDEMRYYCDDRGCYDCDAYGCTNVPTPSRKTCTGASSCDPGQVCTQSGCAKLCSDTSACPKGEVCKSGVCAPPGTDPGGQKECTTKADCGDGKACVAGSCQACGGSAGPCPCAGASDCAAGQACVAGACTAQKNACKFSSECEGGKVCADGECLVSCESAPCSDGFSCDKGVCRPTKPATPQCTTDAQCPPEASQCVGGACVKACSGDLECGAGRFCDQGACIIDTRPKPNCTEDNQCGGTAATPKKCLEGFCKYTCSTDQYCRSIDGRIGFCAKDGVCRTEAEASAECLKPADCSGGKSCIANHCK